jgi:hypothetical protein
MSLNLSLSHIAERLVPNPDTSLQPGVPKLSNRDSLPNCQLPLVISRLWTLTFTQYRVFPTSSPARSIVVVNPPFSQAGASPGSPVLSRSHPALNLSSMCFSRLAKGPGHDLP